MATYFMVKYFRFKKTEYADHGFGLKTQRITTVVLVKQNNFETKAIEFVEAHRIFVLTDIP